MAWTSIKQTVLQDLLQERVMVELAKERFFEWDLSRSWMQIINSHVTDVIKQNVLNDLIDDKTHYLQLEQNKHSAGITNLQLTIDQGAALKE